MTLDVKDTIESWGADVNIDLDAVSQTVDNNIRSREVGSEWWWFRDATRFIILKGVTWHADANGTVICGATLGVGVADSFSARVATGGVAVFVVRTVGVVDTFGKQNGADTDASRSLNESLFWIANAGTVGTHDKISKWIADASSVWHLYLSLDWFAAFLNFRNGRHTTLNSCVPCRSRWTDAHHSSVGVGGFYFTNSRWSARLKCATRVFTFTIDTSFERGAVGIGTTANIDINSSARRVW